MRENTRAQAAVLGFVLLVGVVVVASIGILLVAGETSSSIEQQAEQDRVEGAFIEMSHQIKTASSSQDISRTMDFTTDHGQTEVDPDAGWITVDITEGENTCRVVDHQQLGTVEYEHEETTVAFQGGGVWKSDGNGSSMLSAPNLYYSPGSSPAEATLSLPITSVGGDERIPGDVRFENVDTTRAYPTSGVCSSFEYTNTLRNGDVEITVQSEYDDAWGRFFEAETDGEVHYGPAGSNEVTLVLSTPNQLRGIEGPIVSDAAALELTNQGQIDSYDSADGPYSPPGRENAPVVVEGNFTPSVDTAVKGDVKAGGDAHVSNAIEVSGDTVIGGDSEINNDPYFGGDYHTGGDLIAEGGTFDGDVYAGGDVVVREGVTILGDIHAGGDVTIEHRGEHHNDIYAGGSVTLKPMDSRIVGTVEAGGEVHLEYSGEIDGDVYAGSDVSGDGNAVVVEWGTTVTGDVYAGGEIDEEGTIDGESHANAALTPREPDPPRDPNIRLPRPVDDDIADARATFSSENDNDDVPHIVANRTTGCESGCTLEAGSYYLEELLLDGQGSSAKTLTLDTSDGPIHVYVEDDLSLAEESSIDVVGDGGASVYLDGNFTLTNEAEIHVIGHRASMFWVHMNPGSNAELSVDSSFVGVLNGPGSAVEDGVSVGISGTVEIFGAVIGNVEGTAEDNEIHFDEALTDPQQTEVVQTTAQVSYLDIVVNEIEVTSE